MDNDYLGNGQSQLDQAFQNYSQAVNLDAVKNEEAKDAADEYNTTEQGIVDPISAGLLKEPTLKLVKKGLSKVLGEDVNTLKEGATKIGQRISAMRRNEYTPGEGPQEGTELSDFAAEPPPAPADPAASNGLGDGTRARLADDGQINSAQSAPDEPPTNPAPAGDGGDALAENAVVNDATAQPGAVASVDGSEEGAQALTQATLPQGAGGVAAESAGGDEVNYYGIRYDAPDDTDASGLGRSAQPMTEDQASQFTQSPSTGAGDGEGEQGSGGVAEEAGAVGTGEAGIADASEEGGAAAGDAISAAASAATDAASSAAAATAGGLGGAAEGVGAAAAAEGGLNPFADIGAAILGLAALLGGTLGTKKPDKVGMDADFIPSAQYGI
jgi:hypothetical protein